jgi:predicted MPP superfamily phosphohydrolase
MKLRKFLFSRPGRILLSLIGLGLYYGVFIYPLDSLLSKAGYPALKRIFDSSFTLFDSIFLILFVLPFVGRLLYQLTRSIWSRHFMAIAMTWSGFAFFLFFPTLFLDISHLVFNFDKRLLGTLGFGVLFGSSCLAIYGIVNANFILVNRIDIKHPKIKKYSTAIQLSDVHIGSRSKIYIHKLVTKVNHLNADMVFITGDLVDLTCVEESDLAILKTIKAPVYFVTGNHDRYVNLERLLPILERQDFHIIRNESVSLENFDLIGIDDAEHPKQVERIIPNIAINPEKYNILLYHRPQGFDAAIEHGVNLMLSGHTHYGQIVPFNFMVKQVFKDIKGTIKRKQATLHVSTGTSTWGPIMRIGSNNEITFFEFEPSA